MIMEGQSSLTKQAEFSQKILCISQRILRFLMPNEHPALALGTCHNLVLDIYVIVIWLGLVSYFWFPLFCIICVF